jgi:hypothetical protein
MRKTGKDILIDPSVTNDERHAWLAEATADELSEFLRWAVAKDSWALHGRDALNVVLTKENIKLQRAIKNLTIWIFLLTIVMVLLGFIQVYPNLKNLCATSNSSLIVPKPTSTDNQTANTNRLQDKKDDTFNKTNILNHKQPPNK